MPMAKQKKFNGKVVVGMVLVLVALIFAAVAMVGSWWDMKVTISAGGLSMDTTMGFGLGSLCITGTVLGQSVSACGAYSAGTTGASSLSDISNVMGLANMLTILGLLMAILTFVLIIVGAGRPKLKIGVLLFGIIGAVVLLVAFVYVYTSLPGAVSTAFGSTYTGISGFFGSVDAGSAGKISWGGGMGWYMALMGFILLLIGAIIATTGMKAQPAPMAPPPM